MTLTVIPAMLPWKPWTPFYGFSTIGHLVSASTGGSDDMRVAVVGGLVGGAAVIVGVVLTEVLVRARNRRLKLEELILELAFTTIPFRHILTGRESTGDLTAETLRISRHVSQIITLARWPMCHARQIRAEAESVMVKLVATLAEYSSRGPLSEETAQSVVGSRLASLTFPNREPLNTRIEALLKERGLPTLSEIANRDSPNGVSGKSPPPK